MVSSGVTTGSSDSGPVDFVPQKLLGHSYVRQQHELFHLQKSKLFTSSALEEIFTTRRIRASLPSYWFHEFRTSERLSLHAFPVGKSAGSAV